MLPTSLQSSSSSAVFVNDTMYPQQLNTGAKEAIAVRWAGQEAGIQRKANDLEGLLSQVSRHAAMLNRRAEDEATAVDRLTEDLTNVKKRNASLTAALYEAQDEVRQLRSALVKGESDSALKQQCEKMMQQTTDLENDVESKKCALSLADGRVQELREERKLLEDQIGDLSAQVQQYLQQAQCLQLQLEHTERCCSAWLCTSSYVHTVALPYI